MNSLTYTKADGKYYKDNPEALRIRNTVRDMAAKKAGSLENLYTLSKDERIRLRAEAREELKVIEIKKTKDKGYWLKEELRREELQDLIYKIAPPLNWTRTKRLLPEIDRPKSKRVTEVQVNDPRGFVYVFKDHMKDEGLYKIGSSYKVRKRLDQASVWGDFESIYESEEVTDCAKLEKEVHQSLRKYQVKGEWFKVSEDIAVNTIKEIVNESFNYAIAG